MSFFSNHHNERQITVDGQLMSVAKLIDRYHQLNEQLAQAEQRVS